ncbi:MAG TPA: ABC transporter substrate-binding protein [Flavobacteriaceae bacterium]|nr:ABC transporter substrate-binding protein [Flavobacteriaceae bacterium]
MKKIIFLFLTLGFFSCQDHQKELAAVLAHGDTLNVEYANGFEIVEYEGFKLVTVKDPWPQAEKSFTYLLAEKDAEIPEAVEYDEKIQIPVEKIVVTSTTHIPSLETLGVEKTLKGFPSLGYISSSKTRDLIDAGKIQELGTNQNINTELLLEIQPDVVVGFSVNGNNKAYDLVRKNGIPVVFNSDWTEQNPLGKAEWIKFFGALYNKLPEATAAFEKVEKAYLEAKKLAKSTAEKPRVLAGAMYRDQWFLPYGNSWQGHFIEDAGGEYVYGKTTGNGSIALSFEKVFQDGKDADIWIAPGNFTSYSQLLKSSEHYRKFKAFQNKQIYNYAGVVGRTGGVLYYEFAPNRPDLVLKDLIKIFHPELLPNYSLAFFKSLD